MESFSVPRILISGVAGGVGKSLIGIGLAHELRKRNVSVSCCTVGPNFVQGTLYRRLTGRYTRSFDDHLLSSSQILTSAYQAGVGADLILIEGHDGLYDGEGPGSLKGSDAELAQLTRSQVILVVDARGLGSSVAALIKGFSDFARGFDFAGTILNRCERPSAQENHSSDDAHDVKDKNWFDSALQSFSMKPLLGAMPELSLEVPVPEDVIFQDKSRTSLPRQFLIEIGNAVSQFVDIDAILRRAEDTVALKLEGIQHAPTARRARIAVSDDSCFHMCFQDNLDLFRYHGAEIVTFSPLADSTLPKRTGAVYLTGAYLAEYGAELANNQSMRQCLADFAKGGGVVYSEGGGTAYLCRDFRCGEANETLPGVGVIQASAVSDSKGFSYIDAVTTEETIWGRPGLIVKGVDSGEWRLSGEDKVVKALRMARSGAPVFHEGFSPGAQVLSTFSFAHLGSNPQVAKNLVDAAQVVQKI